MSEERQLPTYDDVAADLYTYFRRLVDANDPSGQQAQATATIARALLSAMGHLGQAKKSESRFARMSKKELIEAAKVKLRAVG